VLLKPIAPQGVRRRAQGSRHKDEDVRSKGGGRKECVRLEV
jgi:hypothetical protein